VKKILTAKTAEEALKYLEESEKSGSFLIGDSKKVYEVEIFKGKMKKKLIKLEGDPYYVKTNHGVLFPDAGHQPSGDSIKRSSSSIRRYLAYTYLQGVDDPEDIPPRMKFQEFDPNSSLNLYRTDEEEHTISQCLMDLTKLKFYLYHDPETADSIRIEDTAKKDKIKIYIIDGSKSS
jgi:Acyl-coenzyme A:6-aminopenicillanic acid acyl-transferase.